jgi:hypothetical protein
MDPNIKVFKDYFFITVLLLFNVYSFHDHPSFTNLTAEVKDNLFESYIVEVGEEMGQTMYAYMNK